MTTDVSLNQVNINVLKKRQYDTIVPEENEIYLLSDANNTQVFLISVGLEEPHGTVDGDKYYNTATRKLYEYEIDSDSWVDIGYPVQEVLYIDKSTHSAYAYTDSNEFIQISSTGGGSSGDTDNVTINVNTNNRIQTIGMIDKNSGLPKYDWIGTKAEYDALSSHNDRWIYYITDDNSASENNSFNNVLNRLNKAYAWKNGNNIRYTVPEPEVNYIAYPSVSEA